MAAARINNGNFHDEAEVGVRSSGRPHREHVPCCIFTKNINPVYNFTFDFDGNAHGVYGKLQVQKITANSNGSIKTEENFDNIILSISDTGGGIDNSIIDKVFEPHFTTKQNGSGVGLYLSRLILEKIGSSIEVKNRGEGVEFIITLKKDIDGK